MAHLLILGRNFGGVSTRVGHQLKRWGHTVTRATTYDTLLSIIMAHKNPHSSLKPFDAVLLHNYTDYHSKRFDEAKVVDELKTLLTFTGSPYFFILNAPPEARDKLAQDHAIMLLEGVSLRYEAHDEWDIIHLLAELETL